MKIGDVVMFTSKCSYSKWFFGKVGIITSYRKEASDGYPYCSVKWMHPVPYFHSLATVSSFRADKFEGL